MDATAAEFTAFVTHRSPRLLLIAQALCGDRAVAEDMVQTALERAFVRWRRLDDDPFGYVRTILVNLNVDRLRRGRERPYSLVPDAGYEQHPAMTLDLTAALAELTPRQRAVVVLRYLEDLSEAETADQLGLARGTVKSTCHRAMERLRSSVHLADQYSAEEHPHV